jgi:transcriptional regulator with XRE-family HTH domain
MPRTRIDVPALYAALDGLRRSRDLSWRQLAAEIQVSASTMTRLANGYSPHVDAFAAMARWLKMPAEKFMVDEAADEASTDDQPELLTEMGVLLRARKDLLPEERDHLQELFATAIKMHTARRAGGSR